jgi:ABC-type Fe3+-hydroxamate transport system substrate-binding protein
MQNKPPRILSLLPSATELLAFINKESLLIARSHECDFPKSIQSLPIVTKARTTFTTSKQVDAQVRAALTTLSKESCMIDPNASLYDLDTDLIKSLKPSLIITQDICSVCSVNLSLVKKAIEGLKEPPKIISLNPNSLEDVLDHILQLGVALGSDTTEYYNKLHNRVTSALEKRIEKPAPNILFLEWLDPAYIGGHWTPQLIHLAGGRHSLNEPVINLQEQGWQRIGGAAI